MKCALIRRNYSGEIILHTKSSKIMGVDIDIEEFSKVGTLFVDNLGNTGDFTALYSIEPNVSMPPNEIRLKDGSNWLVEMGIREYARQCQAVGAVVLHKTRKGWKAWGGK